MLTVHDVSNVCSLARPSPDVPSSDGSKAEATSERYSGGNMQTADSPRELDISMTARGCSPPVRDSAALWSVEDKSIGALDLYMSSAEARAAGETDS